MIIIHYPKLVTFPNTWYVLAAVFIIVNAYTSTPLAEPDDGADPSAHLTAVSYTHLTLPTIYSV